MAPCLSRNPVFLTSGTLIQHGHRRSESVFAHGSHQTLWSSAWCGWTDEGIFRRSAYCLARGIHSWAIVGAAFIDCSEMARLRSRALVDLPVLPASESQLQQQCLTQGVWGATSRP